MSRTRTALRYGAALVLACTAPLVASTAHAQQASCGGLAVTIDLDEPGHVDPDRPAADVILGTPEDDEIRAGGGDDVVCAGDGRDDVRGEAGDDRVFGMAGADDLTGGR